MTTQKRIEVIMDQLLGNGPNLSLEEVEDVLKVGRKTVARLIKQGKLKAFAIDPDKERKTLLVTKAALAAYIVENEEKTKGVLVND
jgi:predicted site-specific integrase-resolvase